jgi:hypothetical protein
MNPRGTDHMLGAITGYQVTEVGYTAATDRRPNKLRSKHE